VSLEPESQKWKLPEDLGFPISAENILRRRQALKRELLKQANLLRTRIAILGGSTTAEIKSMLELFLLAQGIQPTFYESAYNAYFEEAVFENSDLSAFKPEIVLVHTTWQNVVRFPEVLEPEAEVAQLIRGEMDRFKMIWEKIHAGLGAVVIQNNFDFPSLRPLGNLEASALFSRLRFLQSLNAEFAGYASDHSWLLINDIMYLSAQVGLSEWFDFNYWYNYHMAVSPLAAVAVGRNVASIVKSIYGKSKKCLVLDLDNTLWGGVIGDDGLQNLILGRDHPVGEAFSNFQRYVKDLQRRGVLLAVCSKNDLENAKEGFSHPDIVLKLEDFSAFKANWKPKHENIREIASDLNIGLDSIVFVDDNPAERAFVSAQLPEVAVPNVGSDVSLFAQILEHEGYFEPIIVASDDLNRTAYYNLNSQRDADQARFQNHGEFLASLEMNANIGPFVPIYLERITQLINKSNQFNLTTRRFTGAEVEAVSRDPRYVTLYGRLRDKFGDNGIVSVIIGSVREAALEIDLWLMSCRVLKREMEFAMFDALVEECLERGIRTITGVYIPSKKNNMVAEHYPSLGFSRVPDTSDDRTLWQYQIVQPYHAKTQYIRRNLQETSLAAST